MNNKYYVYRFKDKNDNILYVGRTHDLKRRFYQHSHLTDNIVTIEYIECPTETDMVIKEIYYINLYFNEKSTNAKDVYDKPSDFGFNDKWIKYDKRHEHNNENNYDKIYVIRINLWFEYECESSILYYTGGYDKNGFPNTSDNPDDAKRYSSMETINRLKTEIKKSILASYPNLESYEFDIIPEIYKDKEISNYLFDYYHSDDNKRMKELFFEDQYLDIEQGVCISNLSFSHDNYDRLSKILKTNNILTVNEYQSKLRKRINEIESKRANLRKDPAWEDPIWNEEFVKPYIKNNYNPDKALEELFENRKNGNKNFTFELHKCFLPVGYRCI